MKHLVPGLYRGVQVWKVLGSSDTMSLDQIAIQTGYPKASVLRMLKTLCDLRLVERTSDGLYRATARVLYSAGASPDFDGKIRATLEKISGELQVTVEWFELCEEGLLLSRRISPPDAEVHVKARAGFIRKWNDEADAVAVLGYAFHHDAPANRGRLWTYGPRGEQVGLSAENMNVRITAAAKTGLSVDPCYNHNGVKRMAAAVVRNGELAGVVSLALVFTPSLDLELDEKAEVLRRAANRLQEF